jgi:hypothetical protein
MTILTIFLVLLWSCAVVFTLVLGIITMAEFAKWAVTPATRAVGLGLRAVAMCAIIALLVGVPLVCMGWS